MYIPNLKTLKYLIAAVASMMLMSTQPGYSQQETRSRIKLDQDWRFHLGNSSDPYKDFNYGIANLFAKTLKANPTPVDPSFNDSSWQPVQLPHDWAITLPFTNSDNEDQKSHGYHPVGGLYPQNSIGWYRRTFLLPSTDSGRQLSLIFDGAFRDSKVWVNGMYLGGNFSGYLGRRYDITDFVYFDRPNVITVRVDATQMEGWFYEGAGINRHVWLEKTSLTHIDPDRYFVHALVDAHSSIVTVEVPVVNSDYLTSSSREAELRTDILARDGSVVAQGRPVKFSPLAPQSDTVIIQQIPLQKARQWSLEDPYLYRIQTRLIVDGQLVDQYRLRYGLRDIKVTAERGVLLNGVPVKIKGVNLHQDHSGVGSALPDALQYYRIQLLKQVGANAIRTSHGAPAPEFLDACDSLGMLVVDEQRLINSGPEYKEQFRRLLERDRNHPSIFLWSIGNEEAEIQQNSTGKRMALHLMAVQKKLDPYRTSTYGADLGIEYNGINEVIPVRGFNYRVSHVQDYHKAHPEQAILGTEMGSTVMTRGAYKTDSLRGYVIDQDSVYPWWAGTAEQWWQLTADEPWVMGGFVWTGLDYRGEPTPFQWPNVNSHFGMMDLCGFPKNIYYYYKSVWTDQPVVHIGQQWNRNRPLGTKVNVWVYGNTRTVELLLNGKSLGEKKMPKYGHLEWDVPYEPGVLKAVARNGNQVIIDSIVTSGQAMDLGVKVSSNKIQADGEDLSIIDLTALDELGLFVADADDEVDFYLEGPGRILGFGNGDPSDHSPETTLTNRGSRRLFNGHAQIIVQAGTSPGVLQLHLTINGRKKTVEIRQE